MHALHAAPPWPGLQIGTVHSVTAAAAMRAVVKPAGHGCGSGVGSAAVAAGAKKPSAAAVQLAPAVPGAQSDCEHASADAAAAAAVVLPSGQGAQSGRGRAALPPGEYVPRAHASQPMPPEPGAHGARVAVQRKWGGFDQGEEQGVQMGGGG